VQSGKVSEEAIDDKVCRLLRTLDKAGLFEHPELPPEQAIDNPKHHRLAREAASEAIVLLKNEKSLLPLDTSAHSSIAVIGENAKRPSFIGGGSCRVRPHYVISPLEGIQSQAGESVQVSYAVGCATHKNLPLLEKNWLADDITLQYFSNRDLVGDPVHTDTTDRLEMVWLGNTVPNIIDLANFSVRLAGELSVPESGTYELSLSSVGKSRLFIDDALIADIDKENMSFGEEGSKRVEIPLEAGQTHQMRIEYASQQDSFFQSLRVGCRKKIPDDSIQQAAALAAKRDVAIVFAGLTDEWESEGFDRPNMELPGDQAKLIEQVAAANPNTIVVLNVGSPLRMNWLDKVTAVVQAWYLGQETGNAIAAVLFGDENPSGKLPTTFPERLRDNPAYLNYPGENGQVLYGEGLFIGYRYYEKKNIPPLFPFGYGLSYTTFAYRNLKLSKPKYAAGDTIQFSVDVENTGTRAGKETVQVYVRDVQSRLMRPEKELKAFAKVALEPNETKTVTFTLNEEALSYYDPKLKRWVAEAGEFQILIGSSSRDIHLVESFDFAGKPSSR
ncbi:MAG: glycoside hydrolase family 3 C-terminal domain-containing protein, partial [Anaerolineae bacterium]